MRLKRQGVASSLPAKRLNSPLTQNLEERQDGVCLRSCAVLRDGCEAHTQLMDKDGQPFTVLNKLSELKAAKIVSYPKELKDATTLWFKPPGKPTQQGGRLVYPAVKWHFQAPA